MIKIVLTRSSSNEVVRLIAWDKQKAYVVLFKDKKRIGVVKNLESLNQKNIPYENLGVLDESIFEKPLKFSRVNLRVLETGESFDRDVEFPYPNKTPFNLSILGASFLGTLFLFFILFFPKKPPQIKEEIKEHILEIVKRTPPKKVEVAKNFGGITKTEVKKTKVIKKSVRRMGALGVLGQLKKTQSKVLGGVNLNAAKASLGAGLGGGTQGSGGAQTSLYGKGLIASSLGPGQKIQGGGGYGSKGKGGGKAGYGQLSLIGSSGTSLIPLGTESVVKGGLDKDSIFRVIQKNMGQIRFCYEQELQKNPKLSGKVSVHFIINGRGLVQSAKVNQSSLNSKPVHDCIVRRLLSWKFPLPYGGVNVDVSYPFLLKRK